MRFALAVTLTAALSLASVPDAARAIVLPPPIDGTPAPAASASPPAASPVPASPAMLEPTLAPVVPGRGSALRLREIGRVRVTTPYCSTLRASTTPAVDAAIAYEGSALVTLADIIRFGHADNAIAKDRYDRQVQADLRSLVDLSRAGGVELDGLKTLATTATPEQSAELRALRSALLGAKARQHNYVKTLAILASSATARPPEIELDPTTIRFLDSIGTQGQTLSLNAPAILDTVMPDQEDREIRADLGVAGVHSARAIDLGGCAATADPGDPANP